jgi:hypothetical protein
VALGPTLGAGAALGMCSVSCTEHRPSGLGTALGDALETTETDTGPVLVTHLGPLLGDELGASVGKELDRCLRNRSDLGDILGGAGNFARPAEYSTRSCADTGVMLGNCSLGMKRDTQ